MKKNDENLTNGTVHTSLGPNYILDVLRDPPGVIIVGGRSNWNASSVSSLNPPYSEPATEMIADLRIPTPKPPGENPEPAGSGDKGRGACGGTRYVFAGEKGRNCAVEMGVRADEGFGVGRGRDDGAFCPM